MRRTLVERARSKQREKRGAGAEHCDLDELEIAAPAAEGDELLSVTKRSIASPRRTRARRRS